MENNKQFKPFDRVLVRVNAADDWKCDLYSHCTGRFHECIGVCGISESDIIPYEGNEHLLGTTDEPEEVIELESGEYCFGVNEDEYRYLTNWRIFQFDCVKDGQFRERFGEDRYFDYVVRFPDLNPNDVEETKKHILCVRGGKVARYKE